MCYTERTILHDRMVQSNMAHEVMTADQAAAFLQTSRDTLLRKARRGELPAAKLGREWRFRRADLDAWLADGGDAGEAVARRGMDPS
jgi:excisionase family DNA binding protein